jgi:hypothetical protein
MGVCGLWCFIVGYARLRNDLGEPGMLVSCAREALSSKTDVYAVYCRKEDC